MVLDKSCAERRNYKSDINVKVLSSQKANLSLITTIIEGILSTLLTLVIVAMTRDNHMIENLCRRSDADV